jgi:hypothetical protein
MTRSARSSRRRLPILIVAAGVALGMHRASLAETVVEYYNASLDHYFMTPLANEIAVLDAGQIAGWMRTGLVFDASATAGSGFNPVCRFYIPPVHGDSHFFSASTHECAAVAAKIGVDPNFSDYIEETPAEFYIALPDTASGACPAGTSPVYRLWNGRADSNHRYTADRAARDAMISRGYIPEGYGPDGVAMCTPRAGLADSQVKVTGASPYAPNCDGVAPTGTLYTGAEVEPHIASFGSNNLIGVWQQDRWSDGGARGLRTGYSFDGGLTWSLSQAPFTRCSGGNAGNGGDYARASDPWVAIDPNGTAYQSAIAFNGASFAAGSNSAVLVSRSVDGGRTWSNASTLIADGSSAFNDKESISADPFLSSTAYAVWDRLDPTGHGVSYFARTTDGAATWEPARPIYDPGGRNQTLNNQLLTTYLSSRGSFRKWVDFFTEFDVGQNDLVTAHLAYVSSDDAGATWSGPSVISDMRAVGAYDPQNPDRRIRDAANLASFASGYRTFVAVWQDSRFSGGLRDGIAFSQSTDGGVTWSPPVEINAVPGVQAFLPTIAFRDDDRAIAVTYYDMRSDTADPPTLLVTLWLATSTDGGVTWQEHHLAGPFDLNVAPVTEDGLFVGDYQGFVTAGDTFAALFTRTNEDLANRTDIVAPVFRGLPLPPVAKKYFARSAPAAELTPAWRAKIDAAARRTMQQRLMGAPKPTPPRPAMP